METTTLIAYFAALAAWTAAPGPVVALVVARTLGPRARGAIAFAAGLCLGDVIAFLAVVLGFGAWSDGRPEWFALIKYAGIAYLLWLSVSIWRSRLGSEQVADAGWLASAGAGLALCLGNPSTVLIYVLLLPTVAPDGIADGKTLAVLLLVTLAAVAAVFFGVILVTRYFRRAIATPAGSVAFSRITAGVIAASSLWMLAA